MKNQTSEATIERISHDGRGIALIDGKTTFIEGALPGEQVTFRTIKRHRNYDEGIMETVVTPSPMRAEPACPHFSQCGGCQLQHITYAEQIALKQRTLLEQLYQFSHLTPKEILPPLVDEPFHYRSKARLSVRYLNKREELLIGFHEKHARGITRATTCPVLTHPMPEHFMALRECIMQLNARDCIAQIEVAKGIEATALIIRHLQPLSEADQKQLCDFAEQRQFYIYLQPKGLDSIHRLWPTTAPDEDDYLHYEVSNEGINYRFHPTHFTQINQQINQKMIEQAITLLDLKPTDRVLDLFCGLGNFTLPIAKHCASVVGIEGNIELIKLANNNAQRNHINNAEFYVHDLTTPLPQTPWATASFDKILIDPPRTGAIEIVKSIAIHQAKRIVYVSCNPATLARDAQVLTEQGYELTTAGMIDMFPQTRHIEAIALFMKAK